MVVLSLSIYIYIIIYNFILWKHNLLQKLSSKSLRCVLETLCIHEDFWWWNEPTIVFALSTLFTMINMAKSSSERFIHDSQIPLYPINMLPKRYEGLNIKTFVGFQGNGKQSFLQVSKVHCLAFLQSMGPWVHVLYSTSSTNIQRKQLLHIKWRWELSTQNE